MSNTKFSDVAHLYIRCKAEAKYRTVDQDTGKPIVVDLDERTLVGVEETSGKRNLIWKGGSLSINKLKPILRPLSDITEDERRELDNIAEECFPKEKPLVIDFYNVTIFSAFRTKYLLSRHFDLFGLIDAGEAIDATKLPINPYTNV